MLCVCASVVTQTREELQDQCYAAVSNVCADQGAGLGDSKTDNNARLNNRMKVGSRDDR